jgi:hypothetical protein
MPSEPKKLFLLDAYALVYRAHFAFTKTPRINSKGMNTSVPFGFTNTMLEVIQKQKPTHMGVAFDTAAKTFRDKIFKEYKAHRQEMPEDIKHGIPTVKEIIRGMEPKPPANVREVAEGLVYRDFLTVGLLVSRLKLKENTRNGSGLIRDNWIYVQEPDVQVGRLQIFNNWSPYMVADPNTVWLGLEYFCNESDRLWSMTDADLIRLGREELDRIGIIDSADVLDGTVIRMEKTYPAYFGAYDRFDEIRNYVDSFENLFLLGRNGMHRYNNQDHSMLTAMVAVDNILAGETGKANLWEINTEQEYHEEAKK